MSYEKILKEFTDRIKWEIEESVKVEVKMLEDEKLMRSIFEVVDLIIHRLTMGHKIILCGNGGSAADAQHFAAELVSKFRKIRKPFPAISLTTNTSILTALGNDFSFDDIFKRQIEAIGKPQDVLIAISTSGKSKNIINAVKYADENGIFTVGFTGKDGGELAKLCKIVVKVPSSSTPRIQEMHMLLFHTVCSIIDDFESWDLSWLTDHGEE